MSGKKFDSGKDRLELVPPSLIAAVGWVLTDGAKVYGDRNWEQGLKWSRPYAAMLRHLFAWWGGETYDKESGRNHLWHAATELAFLIEYETTNPHLDDRPLWGSTFYELFEPSTPKNVKPVPSTPYSTEPTDANFMVRSRVLWEGNSQRRDISSTHGADSGPQNAEVRNPSPTQLSFDWGLCDS